MGHAVTVTDREPGGFVCGRGHPRAEHGRWSEQWGWKCVACNRLNAQKQRRRVSLLLRPPPLTTPEEAAEITAALAHLPPYERLAAALIFWRHFTPRRNADARDYERFRDEQRDLRRHAG